MHGKDHYCSRTAVNTCQVRKVYSLIQNVLEDSLRNVTFKDLLDDKNAKVKGGNL